MLKEVFGQKKRIPDRNMELHRGMKNIRNGNYISKYITFFL